MSQFARVDSVEMLKGLRVTLCRFAESVKVALAEADSEIQRTAIWLNQDQRTYWQAEVRKRTELVVRAKIALKQKEQQRTPLGGRYSCVDEIKALEAAQRRLDESEEKLANVRRWVRQLDHEAFSYKGIVQALSRAVDADVPVALARLDDMIAALEGYTSLAVPSGEPAAMGAFPTGVVRQPEEVPASAGDDAQPGHAAAAEGPGAPIQVGDEKQTEVRDDFPPAPAESRSRGESREAGDVTVLNPATPHEGKGRAG